MTGKLTPLLTNLIPKSASGIKPLNLNIYGLINHGHNTHLLTYYLNHWKNDSNLSITLASNHIRQAPSDTTKMCPPKLYLQCDNAPKELKNKTMFGYITDIINRGWYKKVHIHC